MERIALFFDFEKLSFKTLFCGLRFWEPAEAAVRGGEPSQRRGQRSADLEQSGEAVSTHTHHHRTHV